MIRLYCFTSARRNPAVIVYGFSRAADTLYGLFLPSMGIPTSYRPLLPTPGPLPALRSRAARAHSLRSQGRGPSAAGPSRRGEPDRSLLMGSPSLAGTSAAKQRLRAGVGPGVRFSRAPQDAAQVEDGHVERQQ